MTINIGDYALYADTNAYMYAEGTMQIEADSNVSLRSISGNIFLKNLPTSNPAISGALWSSGDGYVRIS